MTTAPTDAVERPDPAQQPGRGLLGRLLAGGLLASLVSVPFVLLLLLVKLRWDPLADLDRGLAASLNSLARDAGALVAVLKIAAVVLDPWVFRLAVLAVAVWLWARGARRLAAWAVVTMTVGGVLGVLLKLLVERARPVFPRPVAAAGGYSFPSGHALNAMLGALVLLLVFLPVLRGARRRLAYLAASAAVVLTGLDRVALGVHYLSDVVAGYVVGLAVVVGTYVGFEVQRREQGQRPSSVTEGVDPEAAPEISGDTG